jgi:hypothetical protein
MDEPGLSRGGWSASKLRWLALSLARLFDGEHNDVLREYGGPAEISRQPSQCGSGGVPERSNGMVLKTVRRASASWVRIPPPPLRKTHYTLHFLAWFQTKEIPAKQCFLGALAKPCIAYAEVAQLMPRMAPKSTLPLPNQA